MKINALLLNTRDNVVTCVTEVKAGEEVVYRQDDSLIRFTAREGIPYCHKVALSDLETGDEVIKYGETIGRTLKPIAKGTLVNENNIYSVPRDYDTEMI